MPVRERERQPERERRRHDYDWNEARALQRQRIRQLFADGPSVVRYDDVPWEQVHQAYHKIFTGDNLTDIERKLRRAPIYTMSARLQILDSGARSGNHRHYPEALFYVVEGRGHEVHDGRRWEWGPGDLVVVPRYCIPQHFCDEGPATLFYVVGGFAMEMGLMPIEQFELHSDFVPPDGSEILRDPDGEVIGYRRADGKEILLAVSAIVLRLSRLRPSVTASRRGRESRARPSAAMDTSTSQPSSRPRERSGLPYRTWSRVPASHGRTPATAGSSG